MYFKSYHKIFHHSIPHRKLKEIISPTHALPAELLPDAQSVIAYFIPFTQNTVTSNIENTYSSREWALPYLETNRLILDLNTFIHKQLLKKGYHSVIIPATHNFDPHKLISDWSHRHVAFIAGLGTFGVNHMLITGKGCCGRLGTIVTNLKLSPTPKRARENYLYKYNGSCKKSVERNRFINRYS